MSGVIYYDPVRCDDSHPRANIAACRTFTTPTTRPATSPKYRTHRDRHQGRPGLQALIVGAAGTGQLRRPSRAIGNDERVTSIRQWPLPSRANVSMRTTPAQLFGILKSMIQ